MQAQRDLERLVDFMRRRRGSDDLQGILDPDTGKFYLSDPGELTGPGDPGLSIAEDWLELVKP